MTEDHAEQVALHRWAVIAEGANPRLTPVERGAVVRAAAARTHTDPDGTQRRYSRNTIDRWIRAWRAGGLEALRPQVRADAGVVRRQPELIDEAAALRLELPSRSAAAIACSNRLAETFMSMRRPEFSITVARSMRSRKSEPSASTTPAASAQSVGVELLGMTRS